MEQCLHTANTMRLKHDFQDAEISGNREGSTVPRALRVITVSREVVQLVDGSKNMVPLTERSMFKVCLISQSEIVANYFQDYFYKNRGA